MNRVTFLVDGFNLYHSVVDLKKYARTDGKWLNIKSLCSSYLSLFGKDAVLEEVYYFSALKNYLQSTRPDSILRHRQYIKCLEDTGTKVILGRFKKKDVFCNKCFQNLIKHEEKETDVSIAVKIVELVFLDAADTIVIVSGDTDLAPAIRTALKHFNKKKICFCFPYNRQNRELENLSTFPSFKIDRNQYIKHQFLDPHILKSGIPIAKPATW